MTVRGRWSCGKCGRFIAEDHVYSEDHLDPGAYYGVSVTITADCGRCGPIEGLDVRMSVWGDDDSDSPAQADQARP